MGGGSGSWTSDSPGKGERAVYSCRSTFSGHDGGSKERKKREEWKRLCVYIRKLNRRSNWNPGTWWMIGKDCSR
jgi:hypothetical protein